MEPALLGKRDAGMGRARGGARRGQRLDYSFWTYEELRALAIQLRIRDAERKTHRDLIELLGG